MTETPAAGSRGGRQATSTDPLDTITAIYQRTRETEFGDVCAWMVRTAATNGEYHANDAANWNLTTRNMIGIAARHLTTNGILTPTGEHRPATAGASHGRRSYVYRLTPLGEAAIAKWPKRTPKPKPDLWPAEDDNEPAQATLFTTTTGAA